MASTILPKNFTGNRLQMVLDEVRNLEIDPDLKTKLRNEMANDKSISISAPEPCEVVITEVKYEDIFEIKANRIIKPALSGHNWIVLSVAMSPNRRFLASA